MARKKIDLDTSRIARYVWIGRHDRGWYQDAEQTFVQIFGRHRLDLVTKLFAATSINTSLKANITLFKRALHEIDKGLPLGTTGNFMPNIRQQIEQIRAGKDLTGRKIRSFAAGMSGNRDAVVVDIWLLRAFGQDRKYWRNDDRYSMKLITNGLLHTALFPDEIAMPEPLIEKKGKGRGLFRSGGATDGQYDAIETYVREEAAAMGVQARELSAMIWSGVRIDQGGDRTTRYTDILFHHFTNHLFYENDSHRDRLLHDSVLSDTTADR